MDEDAHRARQDKIMRLSELDCRAALIQLAEIDPATVDRVLEHPWQFVPPADAPRESRC